MRLPWNRSESELQRELAHHLHHLAAEYELQGHSRADAINLAKRTFGGAEQIKEQCRDERRWAFLSGLHQDLAFALRQLRRSPGFALTAVLILALCTAANVIVFGVLDALILRPLNLPHAERIMTLARNDSTFPIFAYPEVRDVRERNSIFAAVAAWSLQSFGLEANGITRPVWTVPVSGNYFEAVGIRPFLGRLLQPADNAYPGASQAALLSWPAWNADFAADSHIVGKLIRINKHPYTIVGVTPPGFYGTEKLLQPDLFIPLANEPLLGVDYLESRSDRSVWSIVRLKDHVNLLQAQSELNRIAAGIRRQFPKEEEKLTLRLTRPGLFADFLGAPARAFLGGVLILACILLLAACANLGSLFAARTADRTREIAIRLAIGSSRWRILRQVLVEAFVISIVGGLCACALAWIALDALVTWHPPNGFPITLRVAPQPSLILAGFLVSLFAGLLFGVMPLRQIFKTDPNTAIRSGANQSFVGRRWAFRDVLLAAQLALCCVTVTAAFVSLRGLAREMTMDLGFLPKHAVRAEFDLNQAGYSALAAGNYQRRLLDRVSQLPGVQAAGYGSSTPLSQETFSSPVFAQQTTDLKPSNKAFDVYSYNVSPGYFAAAGTRLLAGRDVSFTDTAKTPAVAVVNQRFARHLFPAGDTLGRRFKNPSGKSIRIVGIVADGKYLSLSEEPQEAAFFPISQQPATNTALIVRLRPDSSTVATSATAVAVRKAVRNLDPAVPILECGEWNSQLGLTFFVSRVATAALSLFGLFGLLLSITGVFGLASYTVNKRLRELSIRVALGATQNTSSLPPSAACSSYLPRARSWAFCSAALLAVFCPPSSIRLPPKTPLS